MKILRCHYFQTFETGLFLNSLDIQNLEKSVEPQIDKDLCQLAVQFYTLETNQEI